MVSCSYSCTIYVCIVLNSGHSKQFLPFFHQAGEMAMEDKINVQFAKIDVHAEESVASKYDIYGFPTLKLFM